jgi:flavin-dependent dehydrogenase
MAQRVGLNLQVDILEPRDFSRAGPAGCNMCGGIISESLLQSLAAEGIRIPTTAMQRRIDSYFLHMDVGSVRIETPLQEKRIAAVHRGGGPRGIKEVYQSFDAYLLQLAAEKGARQMRERVDGVGWQDGRPQIKTQSGSRRTYDLLVPAIGVNTSALKLFEGAGLAYKAPQSTRAYVCEFYLGREVIKQYLGSSMHVFLLNIPRLEFAALIPKSDYVTVCLLGDDIDKVLVQAFLDSAQVKQCMPPHWRSPDDFCRCSPRINIQGAVEPFADRVVFVGDCGVTRLYKDGIGAAYRTAKAAAVTAIFEGLAAEDFRRHYWPTCQRISSDNSIGKFVFAVTRQLQKRPFARRGVWRMVAKEQQKQGSRRRMSLVLWDTFTGSAPYRSILRRTLHPFFLGRFLWDIVAASRSAAPTPRLRRIPMATGVSGLLGKKYREGDIVYRQGELGDCMYVIQGGQVEVLQRKGDKEFCLGVLGDGDFFGEMAIFEEEVRSATVRALGDVWVFTLEKRSLLQRIHEDPSLAFRIIQKMSHRIRELESALVRQADVAS